MRMAVRLGRALALVALATGTGPGVVLGQGALPAPTREPTSTPTTRVLRAPLDRLVSLNLTRVTLKRALDEIDRQADLRLSYSIQLVPVDRIVSINHPRMTVADALAELLRGTDVEAAATRAGQVLLVRRSAIGEQAARAPGTIVGRVTDAKTGDRLVGAEVFLDGTKSRSTTSESGYYKLSGIEPGPYTLTVRRVGYAKQSASVRVPDGGEVTLDVVLQPLATQLNEIVTTATGDQRRVEVGHVVGVINADSVVKEAPVSTLSDLLNGRVPGLQVSQSQGTVGGSVHLQIRGLNSLQLNNEPIVVIDGVRYTTKTLSERFVYGPTEMETPSPLNDLNPNDIESIEVVKGPSASTLYGTDAANGVLVITTKRGRPGPSRWNVYGRATAIGVPKQRYPDIYWGWGTVDGMPDNTKTSCTLWRLAYGICTQQDSVTVLPNPLNEPSLTLFGTKPRWEYGANVSGGRQDLRYYFSSEYENATGPLQMPVEIARQLMEQRGLKDLPDEWKTPNTQSKLNLRANVAAMLGEQTDIRVNSGYVHGATRSLGLGYRNPYAQGTTEVTPESPYGDMGYNPAESFAQDAIERVDRFFGNANGQWRIARWLSTRATIGLDLASNDRNGLSRRGDAPTSAYPDGVVSDNRMRQLTTTGQIDVTGTIRRGRMTARTAIGAQYVRSLSDAIGVAGFDLPPGGTSVGEAATVYSTQTYQETATLGSYAEETLGFNDRLFLTGALRMDGASTFGQNYDAVIYPKASLSWLLSEEPFFPRVPGLEELRLRYAFGASGQQPKTSMAKPQFATDRTIKDGEVVNAMRLAGLGNPNLRPERVREHEFGFDATALANHLRVGLTWYSRRTTDQIVSTLLPPGMNALSTNLGLTSQHGFEAELTAHLLDSRAISLDVMLQHALHRTKLINLGDAQPERGVRGGYVEGYPLGARFQLLSPGYVDANGDGIIDYDELQLNFVSGTEVYAGESAPPVSQTLTTVVGLFDRKLRLSALLERRTGFTQINSLAQSQCDHDACRARVDPATSLADQAEALAAPYNGTKFIEPGDFTRLREVTAAVDLPSAFARALRVRSATLAISARNLALWTEFSGPDPESATIDGVVGGAAEGIPQSRSWTVRLDLGL